MSGIISIWEVLVILFIHWIADFVLQTDQQAKNKSSSWKWLLGHTTAYSVCFFLPSTFFMLNDNYAMLLFAPITFLFHTATDYYTSKVNSQLYKDGKNHDFFVSIGFDQLLHFAQLLITYQLLK